MGPTFTLADLMSASQQMGPPAPAPSDEINVEILRQLRKLTAIMSVTAKSPRVVVS